MIFAIAAGTAAVLLLCLTYLCYRIVFYSPDKKQNNIYNIPDDELCRDHDAGIRTLIDSFAAMPYEPVSITSADGLKLTAKYYHCSDDGSLAICFHGYRGTGIRDFCGGVRIAFALNQNVLLVDERAQGQSAGHTITFGIKEQEDCFSWIEYARSRFGTDRKILLYGVSMGAATVLMAAGHPLPANVAGVIADSPYATAKGIIRKVCRQLHLPDALFYPFIAAGAYLFGHFNLEADSPLEAAERITVPTLIIHGEADHFVPCEMSEKIQQKNPDRIERYTFAGAGHGLSYLADRQKYETIVKNFYVSHISAP